MSVFASSRLLSRFLPGGLAPRGSARRPGASGLALLTVLLVVTGLAGPAWARAVPESFADLVDQLSPAVVNISTAQNVGRPSGPRFEMPDLPPGSPFEEFFREFFDQQRQRGPRKVRSLGSGFIIDPKGVIVTNNHVIDEADEITVIFNDGRELPATLIGRDKKTDLAVLQVKPDKDLPFVRFGDSDAIRVGDWVLAIGNPLGFGGTVTAGIVSARNRDIDAGPYDDFIQTDAAINRGNSGGPLFNMKGEVIGVNTAIVSPNGGSIGIGFAIPSAIVKNVVSQLREFGEMHRGWLGVRIQTVTPEIAESMNLDKPKGALVAGVDENSPAAEAGLQVGDLILKFDGKDVPEMRDLPRIVAETEIGKHVEVEVLRNGKRKTFEVNIARLKEDEDEVADSGSRSSPDKNKPLVLGLTLSKLTPALRSEYHIPDDVEGVLVVGVDFDSNAAEKVREGDVIVSVGGERVKTPQDVVRRVKELTANSNKPVLLLLNRGGEQTFRSVRPDKK